MAKQALAHVLMIRFSSIGDIVLTTPVIRSLKQHSPDTHIHFLTKQSYAHIVEANPYVDHVHVLSDSWQEMMSSLREYRFDYLLDLHQNLRSFRVRLALRCPSRGFRKRNLAKYLLVRTKREILPIRHVVDRYGEVLKGLGAQLDGEGLDFFVSDHAKQQAQSWIGVGKAAPFAVVLGAKHPTKRWPIELLREALIAWGREVILLGGPDTRMEADELVKDLPIPIVDAVGKTDLMTSAAILEQSSGVLTHDTGLMHIAAAMGKPLFVLWGSTVPALGFTPYRTPHHAIERLDVECRPCSKIGHQACPLGHFRCMREISPAQVVRILQQHG